MAASWGSRAACLRTAITSALIIVVRRINLFELIEHKVNVTCVAPSKRIDAISSLKPANLDWIICSRWPRSICLLGITPSG
jgi:hypothetical protein